MTKRASSCTAASPGFVLSPPVASPMPIIPSSVNTLTKTQFFHGLPAMYVFTSVIFTLSSLVPDMIGDYAHSPPEMFKSQPVIWVASSDAKNATPEAMSSTDSSRPSGTFRSAASSRSTSPSVRRKFNSPSVAIQPTMM